LLLKKKSQRDSFEKRFESKDEELRAALKEVAEVKKLEDRYHHGAVLWALVGLAHASPSTCSRGLLL